MPGRGIAGESGGGGAAAAGRGGGGGGVDGTGGGGAGDGTGDGDGAANRTGGCATEASAPLKAWPLSRNCSSAMTPAETCGDPSGAAGRAAAATGDGGGAAAMAEPQEEQNLAPSGKAQPH